MYVFMQLNVRFYVIVIKVVILNLLQRLILLEGDFSFNYLFMYLFEGQKVVLEYVCM